MAAEIGVVPGGGQPYGDIYNTNMPDTQAAAEQVTGIQGKMLLMKQREDAAQKQAKLKEAKDQQDAINAKVRGIDAPLVNNQYDDIRTATMDLEKNKNTLPRDVLIDRQQQLQTKWGNLNKFINDSVQWKAVENDRLKDGADPSKQYLHSKGYGNYVNQSINTPLDQLESVPMTDEKGKPIMGDDGKPKTMNLRDNQLYNYTPIADFTTPLNDSAGKSDRDLAGGIDVSKPGSINGTLKSYKGINNAFDMYNTFTSGLKSDDEKNKIQAIDRQADYVQQHGNVSDTDIATMHKNFQENYLNNPEVREAYGLKGNETFPSTGIPQIDKYARYDVEQKALSNLPNKTLKPYTNEAAKTAVDHQWDKDFYNYKKNADKDDSGKSIEDSWSNMSKGNGTILQTQVANPSGNGVAGTENRTVISAPTPFKKMFAVQVGNKDKKSELLPDDVVIRPNGNYVGLYYQRNGDGSIKTLNGSNVARTDVTPVELDPNTAKTGFAKAFGGDKAVQSLSKYNDEKPAKIIDPKTGKSFTIKGSELNRALEKGYKVQQ